jgi:hypothetical protein
MTTALRPLLTSLLGAFALAAFNVLVSPWWIR